MKKFLKQSLLNHRKLLYPFQIKFSKMFFSFKNVSFVDDFHSKYNLIFVNKEELLENTENEKFRLENPIAIEEFKESGITSIHKKFSQQSNNKDSLIRDQKLIIIKNDFENKIPFSKKLQGIVSSLMTLNIKSIQVNFSPKIIDIEQRNFIINKLFLANYIPNATDKSGLSRDKYKPLHSPTTIDELKIFNDSILKKAVNQESFSNIIALSNARNFARDLANTRPNKANCDFMEIESKRVIDQYKDILASNSNNEGIKSNIKIDIEVIKGKKLLEERMNLLHAVGKSAQSEPRLVILKYTGIPEEEEFSHCILGKGLIFDSGGLNLKPTGYIEDMFLDKHGACNSLAIFKYICELKLKINVLCALTIAENSIDSKSYKPSDILTSRKGFTVEIGNTDAEGRLCLADAMTYIQDNYKPKVLIDMATLTGACVVALVRKSFIF